MLFHVEWEFIDNTEAGEKLPSTSSRNGSLVPHSSRASIGSLTAPAVSGSSMPPARRAWRIVERPSLRGQ